ncbi:MAG: 7-carboxy-7-deazaguanine synthase [Acidobacteriota bacterium]
MNISEIFYSIQGESTFSGRPCAFIRLAGCDLRCKYCDTEYAFADGTEIDNGYTVQVETGGHRSVKNVDPRIHKIMDFKCPSSGMASRNHYENIHYLTARDELKFVIGDRGDFDWACDLIRLNRKSLKAGSVLFSPVHPTLAYETLADWILSCGLDVRLQLQIHKVIWPGIRRGV